MLYALPLPQARLQQREQREVKVGGVLGASRCELTKPSNASNCAAVSIYSPGESHSCKELIQSKRSATKNTQYGPVCLRHLKGDFAIDVGDSLPRFFLSRYQGLRSSSACCRTESIKRGDHPSWASDATKWRQWPISIKAEPLRGKVRHASGFCVRYKGAVDWDCRSSCAQLSEFELYRRNL